jgi:hypothetical protein
MNIYSLLEFVHAAVVAAALRFHHLLGLVNVVVGQPAHRAATVTHTMNARQKGK